jgi:DNA ligase D-like protein (predicted ligase)
MPVPASRNAVRSDLEIGFVLPILPTSVSEPPSGEGWLHEIKHDGYRTLIVIDDGRVRAFTRNGYDWTERYSRVVACAAQIPCGSAILDGEMVVQNEAGLSDFHALRRAISDEPQRLVFFAFDLLHLNGQDLRGRALSERKQRLRTLLAEVDAFCPIQFCAGVVGDGAAVFAAAERMGLEGIVSKRLESRYRSGRSTAWLKTKCMTESEFVVVGMEPNPGGPPFALLAREEGGSLTYVGSAFVTLPQPARDAFWTRTAELAVDKPAFRELRSAKASFVRPELRVKARHLRGGDVLRHATLTALL